MDAGEIELFKDGKLSVELQLVGGDISKYWKDGKFRLGTNFGIGISQLNDASVLLTETAGFIQIGSYYRIDMGWMRGASAKLGLDKHQRDQSAWFVGISFPTKLNDLLKKAISNE